MMSDVDNIVNSYDGSFLEFIPLKVFYPKNKIDVKKIIKLANKNSIPIHAKGQATSVAGNSLGPGYVINFSKYMNKILKVSDNYIDVEPGLTASNINKVLKDKFFPIDPSSFDFCSIGGMVLNNASGLHSLKYGVTKDYVLGIEGYYPDGSFFSTIKNYNIKNKIIKLNKIYKKFLKYKKYLPNTLKSTSGYNLEIDNNDVNFNKLIAGSEGTLLIVTKIRLKIIPKYKHKDTLLILFKNIKSAICFVQNFKNHDFSSLELLDTKLINLCKKHYVETRKFFLKTYNAGIIAEIHDSKIFTNDLIKNYENKDIKIIVSKSNKMTEQILYLRKAASPILNRARSNKRPLRIIEDIIVPIDKISEFYFKQKKILKKYKYNAVFFGHIGEGHFHINPSINTDNYLSSIKKLALESYSLSKSLNGSLAGEHGIGYIRTYYLKKFYPELCNIYKEVKLLFDRDNILNPNKIINPINFTYKNSKYKKYKKNANINNYLDKCTGCNNCLNFCKSFKENNDEKFKTRGRIYILKNILNKNLSLDTFYKYVLNCKKCGKCLKNCPTGIDMPKLILKFKKDLKIKGDKNS